MVRLPFQPALSFVFVGHQTYGTFFVQTFFFQFLPPMRAHNMAQRGQKSNVLRTKGFRAVNATMHGLQTSEALSLVLNFPTSFTVEQVFREKAAPTSHSQQVSLVRDIRVADKDRSFPRILLQDFGLLP